MQLSSCKQTTPKNNERKRNLDSKAAEFKNGGNQFN